MTATLPDDTACPSSRCRPGAVLVGLVMPDGRVAFADQRVAVDEEFVRIAHEGRPPEQRFRFSLPCMGDGCAHWTERKCGLVDRLMSDYTGQFGSPSAPDPLPNCPIRTECRWFVQHGGAACAVCSVVVTDRGRPDGDLPQEVLRRRQMLAAAAQQDSSGSGTAR